MTGWGEVCHADGRAARAAAPFAPPATVRQAMIQVNGLRGDVRQKLEELGQAALELCRRGVATDSSLEPYFEEIDRLEARIAELEGAISRTHPAHDTRVIRDDS